jgi:adenosylcobinamide-GDP ribazoletransferase
MTLAPARTAIAMFTVLPVPRSWHAAGGQARAVLWLPALGALLGALAALPAALAVHDDVPLVGAVLAVACLAALTRGLHLDGLADTADGLGSRSEPARALEIMKQSDIGPFGVMTIVMIVLVDVASLADLGSGTWRPVAALAVAAATGRLAVVHACLPGIPSARPGGFGALVAGTARPAVASALTVVVLAAAVGLAYATDADPLRWAIASAAALLFGAAARLHIARRLGGVTGDVFGALVELTTAACLVGLVL